MAPRGLPMLKTGAAGGWLQWQMGKRAVEEPAWVLCMYPCFARVHTQPGPSCPFQLQQHHPGPFLWGCFSHWFLSSNSFYSSLLFFFVLAFPMQDEAAPSVLQPSSLQAEGNALHSPKAAFCTHSRTTPLLHSRQQVNPNPGYSLPVGLLLQFLMPVASFFPLLPSHTPAPTCTGADHYCLCRSTPSPQG